VPFQRRWTRRRPVGPWAFSAACLLLASCTTTPPRNVDDACAIFAEYGDWFADAKAASQRWGCRSRYCWRSSIRNRPFAPTPEPPRTWYLGFIPGPRPSSAYGYSQALDGTWDRYTAATGNVMAPIATSSPMPWISSAGTSTKPPCATASPNVATPITNIWLITKARAALPRALTGKKPWLMERARKVSRQAARYGSQLARCESQLLARN
jgi:hypothetical protein